MARFADLIGPAAPPESGSTPADVHASAPAPARPVATHDEVSAALSDLVLASSTPTPEPAPPVDGTHPDPTAALAAAFRTVMPEDAPPAAVEARTEVGPIFDDNLLPTRATKSGRRR